MKLLADLCLENATSGQKMHRLKMSRPGYFNRVGKSIPSNQGTVVDLGSESEENDADVPV